MFELVLLCADQLHVDFHTRCAPAPGEATWKFDAFSQLQARACAIGREIHDNLDLGYVQVAAARWRTLHELAVEARLLQMNDEAVAERYLSHETIAVHKAVKAYEENCTSLGLKSLSSDVVQKLDAEREALRERFGSKFTGDYGWAADTVEGWPTFVDLEKAVGLAHLRYWYDFMCKVTHGGARGLSLASLESRARASSAALALVETGLPFVAHGSLVSLFQISTAVASLRPDVLQMSVLVQTISCLLDDAAVAFASINDEWFKEGQTGWDRAEAP